MVRFLMLKARKERWNIRRLVKVGRWKCQKKARVISVLEEWLPEDDTGYFELKVFQTIHLILWKTTPDNISVFQDRTNILFIKNKPMHVGTMRILIYSILRAIAAL